MHYLDSFPGYLLTLGLCFFTRTDLLPAPAQALIVDQDDS